jgi:hypothetical protein
VPLPDSKRVSKTHDTEAKLMPGMKATPGNTEADQEQDDFYY